MRKFKVYCPDIGETRDDPTEVEAPDDEAAAREHLETFYQNNTVDWDFGDSGKMLVVVDDRPFRVTYAYTMTFDADDLGF